jgi:hypothetical protein
LDNRCNLEVVRSPRSFQSTHVKPYTRQPSVRNDDNLQDSVSGTNRYSTDAFHYENSTYDTRISAPYTQDYRRHTALHSPTDEFASSIFASRIVESNFAESKSASYKFAKENAIAGLFDRRTFELIKEDEIQKGSNFLGTRFVLCLKQKDGKWIHKARLIIQGHKDNQKQSIVSEVRTVSRLSIRMLLSISAMQ